MVLWNTLIPQSMAIMLDKMTLVRGHGIGMVAEVFGGMKKVGYLVKPLI